MKNTKNDMEESIQNKVYKYWDAKAKKEGIKDTATLADLNLRKLEIEKITINLKKNDLVLDIGCGNGNSTLKFSEHVKEIVGVDYSENMIKQAKKLSGDKKQNVSFEQANVLDLPFNDGTFDVIISERCLINIFGLEEKKKAIKEVFRILKPGGKYIMCESTVDGLNKLNNFRKKFNLEPCPVVWHNQPFDKKELIDFTKKFAELEKVENFGLYYLISRIIHPLLVTPEEPKWDAKINDIARQIALKTDVLPEISYESVFIFRKNK